MNSFMIYELGTGNPEYTKAYSDLLIGRFVRKL